MALQITQHFAADEFACHDGVPYPAEWIADRLAPLCAMLEVVRSAAGDRWIEVVSGYRTPAHNAKVGGAGGSQHVEGRAADIIAEGMSPADLHAIIDGLYRAGKLPLLGGLGLYARWVHVDCRPRPADGHLARWKG